MLCSDSSRKGEFKQLWLQLSRTEEQHFPAERGILGNYFVILRFLDFWDTRNHRFIGSWEIFLWFWSWLKRSPAGCGMMPEAQKPSADGNIWWGNHGFCPNMGVSCKWSHWPILGCFEFQASKWDDSSNFRFCELKGAKEMSVDCFNTGISATNYGVAWAFGSADRIATGLHPMRQFRYRTETRKLILKSKHRACPKMSLMQPFAWSKRRVFARPNCENWSRTWVLSARPGDRERCHNSRGFWIEKYCIPRTHPEKHFWNL